MAEDPGAALSSAPHLINTDKNGYVVVPAIQATHLYGGWDPITKTWPAAVGELLEIIRQ